MNKIFNLFVLFSFFSIQAQIHEVGAFVGLSNYVGDVGPTNYIHPKESALGILYKWNKSPRHSYRISYTQTNLSADDLLSKEESRFQRAYSFTNSVKELSFGLEFNFFDFNLHKPETKVTPYLFSGISFFKYDELYIDSGGQTFKEKNKNTVALPLNFGIKSNINSYLVIGLEIGARFTLTDNIDGSNPKNENFKTFRFGNLNNNDVYLLTGLTLTYTFGETPCYCAE
jgi:hypothetical protein